MADFFDRQVRELDTHAKLDGGKWKKHTIAMDYVLLRMSREGLSHSWNSIASPCQPRVRSIIDAGLIRGNGGEVSSERGHYFITVEGERQIDYLHSKLYPARSWVCRNWFPLSIAVANLLVGVSGVIASLT